MTDSIGVVLLTVAIVGTLLVIGLEFRRAFRAHAITGTGAGRISVATGLLILVISPAAYPGLDDESRNIMSWFGGGLVAMGFLLEFLDERRKRSKGPEGG